MQRIFNQVTTAGERLNLTSTHHAHENTSYGSAAATSDAADAATNIGNGLESAAHKCCRCLRHLIPNFLLPREEVTNSPENSPISPEPSTGELAERPTIPLPIGIRGRTHSAPFKIPTRSEPQQTFIEDNRLSYSPIAGDLFGSSLESSPELPFGSLSSLQSRRVLSPPDRLIHETLTDDQALTPGSEYHNPRENLSIPTFDQQENSLVGDRSVHRSSSRPILIPRQEGDGSRLSYSPISRLLFGGGTPNSNLTLNSRDRQDLSDRNFERVTQRLHGRNNPQAEGVVRASANTGAQANAGHQPNPGNPPNPGNLGNPGNPPNPGNFGNPQGE